MEENQKDMPAVQETPEAQGITPVAFVETYGCQQNEADSERIRGYLREMSSGEIRVVCCLIDRNLLRGI